MAKLSLTKEETGNLQGRYQARDYFNSLIQIDISNYLTQVVCKRLNIPENAKFKLSEDLKEMEVIENEANPGTKPR